MNTKELISSIWNSWEWHFIWDWNRLKARIRCDCSGWVMMAGEVSEKYRRIMVAFLFIVRTDLPWNHNTLSGNTAKSLSTPVERDRPKCDHEKQHFDMFVSRLSRRTFYCWLSIMSAWTEWVNRRTHWQFNCSLLKTIGTHRSQKQRRNTTAHSHSRCVKHSCVVSFPLSSTAWLPLLWSTGEIIVYGILTELWSELRPPQSSRFPT